MFRRSSNNIIKTTSEELNIAEIIAGRLYFLCLDGDRKSLGSANGKDAVFFTVDKVLNYEAFFADFGPLNLGRVYRFCQIVHAKLKDPQAAGKKVYIYTARGPQKKANTAFLVGAYQILCMNKTAKESYSSLAHIRPEFLPFRDASMSACMYKLTVDMCLNALESAKNLRFIDYDTFDLKSYELYERVENGDLNVVVPNKFVHFSGPSDTRRDQDGYPALMPEDYLNIFQSLGVTDIIRLNKICYDKKRFTKHGFKHHDMYFIDGTTPTLSLLHQFISVCENAKGMVAVHCKAGLGRTGSCVGNYIMKHYHMTAAEVIGWLRICRPGSVIGPQQLYLENMQERMWKEGEKFRKKNHILFDKKLKTNIIKEVATMHISTIKDSPKILDGFNEKFEGPFTRSKAAKGDVNAKNNMEEFQGFGLVRNKFNAQKQRSLFSDENNDKELLDESSELLTEIYADNI